MSRKYLTLNNYDGSITGFGENPAGPNDIASPGGLASIHHHWTQGMGGLGDRTSDVFAGTGERYPAGVYGSLYEPNSHSSIHQRHYGPHTVDTQETTLSGQPYHWQSKSTNSKRDPIVENYTDISNFDLVDEQIRQDVAVTTGGAETGVDTISAYFMLVLFLVAYITFEFWSESVHLFIQQYINKGVKTTWKQYLALAVVATVTFLLFLTAMDIPLSKIESSSLVPPF